jgi:hypothetical protein
MSYYETTPFKNSPKLLISGRPVYLFGSYNDRTSPTFGYVISNSAVTTTGTVVFQIKDGNAPFVGALITVRGTANGGGNFNVVNATIITAVTDMNTGICTVTYAIPSTSQGTLADGGQVEIPQPEVGEALVAGNSAPVAVSFSTANPDQKRGVTVVVSFPTMPSAASVVLQQAVLDIDSEYATINTVATVVGSTVTVGPQVTIDPVLGRFFRLHTEAAPGGTIVAKILS